MVANEFRMTKVANDARSARRPANPPQDYREQAVEYINKGDAGDELTTLLYYGGAEARAALYAADQVAKQTEILGVQAAASAQIAVALNRLVELTIERMR